MEGRDIPPHPQALIRGVPGIVEHSKCGIMPRLSILLAAAVMAVRLSPVSHAAPQAFCNPVDLPLDASKGWRHAADPVVVFYHDKYWLFTTWDFDGYRVSDDLIHWRDVRFDPSVRGLATEKSGEYCGPAVAVVDGWMVFMAMHQPEREGYTPILRTRDPLSGKWEKCGETRRVQDPALFADGGRLFIYYGLGEGAPTRVRELDARTFSEIPGSDKPLRPRIRKVDELTGGIELGRREIFAETDTGAFFDSFRILPCQEGAWMTRANGRYYLQYATPGTICQWYADVVMEGPSPTGPFREVGYSPASMKAGGFIGGAGHGSVFQDRHGNWWRMSTMWIGVHDRFERRIGLFPAGFDSEGRMFTRTEFGDYPQFMPQGARKSFTPDDGAGGPAMMRVSESAVASASSSAAGCAPALASDENVRTWWAAASGASGEWLALDLGEKRTIRAIQVNLAEHDRRMVSKAPSTDGQAFRVEFSDDGVNWRMAWDRSKPAVASAHAFHVFSKPLESRHLRVVNAEASAAGPFALRDVRVFGNGHGSAPDAVGDLRVERDSEDRRFARFRWRPVSGADGYVLRFGAAPEALHLAIQIAGGATSDFSTHVLNRGAACHFRLDAFNENGVTPGETVPCPP